MSVQTSAATLGTLETGHYLQGVSVDVQQKIKALNSGGADKREKHRALQGKRSMKNVPVLASSLST